MLRVRYEGLPLFDPHHILTFYSRRVCIVAAACVCCVYRESFEPRERAKIWLLDGGEVSVVEKRWQRNIIEMVCFFVFLVIRFIIY